MAVTSQHASRPMPLENRIRTCA